MCKIAGNYVNDPKFQEFLNREFNQAAISSTMEELAEFAFGNIDEAIKKFEKQETGLNIKEH